MSDQDHFVRSQMQGIARAVKKRLPKNYGFFVLVFPFGDEQGRANYVSNGTREDVILSMKEFIRRNEHKDDWMTHQEE